ncbi:putative Type IV pilus assembly protein PilV [Nitrospira sp. KM1]|uniref:type IV pilus modification protein PilV n=1 Tax=Nitrospira sp. KM1 TaxID=1936990 RepID=UPI0013A75B28|nr:type IV pilus modification protein PilV [Nitrospira sp. KM1]BCA54975.1 putative Type IV pilus assembly protein PilV [Nitrospira sp. KM1]
MSSGIKRLESQSGFTLIETMLAAVILAIGLLALSGMQSITMKKNIGSSEMTKVTNLAADMVERIQFNRRNVTAYHNITVSSSTTSCPTTATNVMANGDCSQWATLLLNAGLANVVGTVSLNPVPPVVDATGLTRSTVTVRLDWLANSNAGSALSATKTISLVTVVAPE